MLFLMGLAAIAIDGSNLYRERGDVQNAADLAVLAAAYDNCTGGSDPAAAGSAQAAANGYTHNGSDVVVTVAKEGDNWRATIDTTMDGFFSKILGASTLSTGATALALCTVPTASGYALFAGGVCGKKTLKWSGSSNTITGGVHSNDQMKVSGSSNAVNGDTTTVNGINVSGSSNTFDPPATTPFPPPPWPVTFDINDFLPDGFQGGNGSVAATVGFGFYHFWDGKIDTGVLIDQGWFDPVSKVLDDGVYVATEDINVSGSDVTGTVTLVTAPTEEGKGIIKFSGSNQNLDPYYQGLLAFSDAWKGGTGYPWNPEPPDHPDCLQTDGIHFSGSNQEWDGIMFAPRSGVVLSGSSNVAVNGSIVAYTIAISGSSQTITSTGSSSSGSAVTVFVE